jgi:hypothetical protein
MKLGELKNASAPLMKIAQKELPIRIAYKFNKIVTSIDNEMETLENFRIKLVEKYGTPNDKGGVSVQADNLEAFNIEYKELLDTTISIDIIKFPLSMFENADIKMSIKDINALDTAGFIKED